MIAAFVVFCAVLVWFILQRPGPPSRTIYSSLPKHEAGGGLDKQSADMELAIRLALKEADGRAGDFEVKYVPLNASDEDGEILPETIRRNANVAADDSEAAVYIGDRTSSASIASIPILSEAQLPQISPASTRVGLTIADPTADANEPGSHYHNGYRNFVRVIPNDNVQAAALVTLMQRDGCKRVAMIYDGGDYSAGLSSTMSLFRKPTRVFRQAVRPNAAAPIYERFARTARARRADCFQYSGGNNPNTQAIFSTFAAELPDARLYASDGVSEASFQGGTTGASGCIDVSLMVPPRDLTRSQEFLDAFKEAYPAVKAPDPYAIYAYEAMRLALDAIEGSSDGSRTKILDALRRTSKNRPSPLGTYSLDDNGDTTLVDYDVSRISGCQPRAPQRAVSRQRLERALRALRKRSAIL